MGVSNQLAQMLNINFPVLIQEFAQCGIAPLEQQVTPLLDTVLARRECPGFRLDFFKSCIDVRGIRAPHQFGNVLELPAARTMGFELVRFPDGRKDIIFQRYAPQLRST